MLRRLSLSLCLVVLCTLWSMPNLAVVDVANLGQNTITAIESVLTTIQAILIEANQILELTPLDDIAIAGGIAEDMALLGQLVEQAEGLSYDIGSLQAQLDSLFNLDSAPIPCDGLTGAPAEINACNISPTAMQPCANAHGTALAWSSTSRLLNASGSLIGLEGIGARATHDRLPVSIANLDGQDGLLQRHYPDRGQTPPDPHPRKYH